jgi:uncharacterized protein
MTETFLNGLAAWVGWVCRNPRVTLLLLAILTFACGWYSWDRFRINSDLSGLITQTSTWRADFDEFEAAFPDQLKTAVVVVHGDSFGDVERVARDIEAKVRAEPRFVAVSAPQNLDFLRDRALLYLPAEDLDEMSDRLAEAQPVLTAIAEDPSLRGVLEVLGDAISNADDAAMFATVLELVTKSGERRLYGEPAQIPWTDELFSPDPPQIRVITLKGRPDFGVSLPSKELLALLDATIDRVERPAGVNVGVTGEIALTHEEIQAATGGVNLAGWISTAFLALVMIVGVRSMKIVLATMLMLLVGVILTTAWAMTTVGEFNTLSLVFVVMFFGLGVDYALHFSLRYQESINHHEGVTEALVHAARGVGDAIGLCALTTIVAFLAFWPTRYQGLADLGIISAGGMAIAYWLAFTLEMPSSDALVRKLIRHRPRVMIAVTVMAVVAGVFAARAHFDYSVLALRDESTESMRMLRFLQNEGVATDYALYVVHAPGELDVAALEALPMVRSVLTPEDYVPKNQDDKLYVIEELNLLLESALNPMSVAQAPDASVLRGVLTDFADLLDASALPGAATYRQLSRLPEAELLGWQEEVVSGLRKELDWMGRALVPESVTFEDLPPDLVHRFVSADGRHLSVILPQDDITDVESLATFIDSVHTVAPKATGRPVIEKGVGEIVQQSFMQATITAAGAILLILLLVFRSLKSAFLISVPLLLAGLFTLAIGELFDAPLNMANILVLPLIFGLGVDNGIHVYHRYHQGGDVAGLMHSSTPRSVFLSTLTTVGAFASLMLSSHVGTASIGLYLTLSIGLLLVFAIFLLPVLLQPSR